jgi:hypothetical protein
MHACICTAWLVLSTLPTSCGLSVKTCSLASYVAWWRSEFVVWASSNMLNSLSQPSPVVLDFPQPVAEDHGGVYAVGDHRRQNIACLHSYLWWFRSVRVAIWIRYLASYRSGKNECCNLDPFESEVEGQDSFQERGVYLPHLPPLVPCCKSKEYTWRINVILLNHSHLSRRTEKRTCKQFFDVPSPRIGTHDRCHHIGRVWSETFRIQMSP